MSLQGILTTEPERRRRRPPVQKPCSNCLRSKNDHCVYDGISPPPPERRPDPGQRASAQPEAHHRAMSMVAYSTGPSTPEIQTSVREVESLRFKVKQLEDQLSTVTQRSVASSVSSPNLNISTTKSHLAGTFHLHSEGSSTGPSAIISRAMMHKSRLFGQSYWMNGSSQFFDILEAIEPFLQKDTSSVRLNLQKCKWLGKVIKSGRNPASPTLLTSSLPGKDITDTLVDTYLRTIETVYRILHIPSFRKDYEAYWTSTASADMTFLVQLKLVLSIGAAMYDDRFSLRASAILWIYEAQTWISGLDFKPRLNIQFLQTSLLLLLARQIVGVDEGFIWISVGELIRTAIHMGLHRDPLYLPKRTTFIGEMRRRLWNTIIELTLQTSMESGGPPLISLDDFDTHPPGNFDDDEIMAENSMSKPEEIFTQMSIALALREMFPLRLVIAKSLNGIGDYSAYEETLRLDTELRKLYKSVCQTVQRRGFSSASSPSQFQIRTLDFLIRRYQLALHMPFIAPAMHETAYAFSRKVVVESALKIWSIVYPSSSVMVASSHGEAAPSGADDLVRLAFCGSGPFRTTSIQACFLIAAELKTQLQEDDSLGPVTLRRDLLSVLDDAKNWNLQCIEAGETNIKGYLFMCMIAAQIGGLVQGLQKDQFPEVLVKAADDAMARCLPLLEEKVAQNQDTSGLSYDGMVDTPSDAFLDLIGDWNFMIPDNEFGSGAIEPTNWVYNGFI
ncbi:Transcription factor [Aspergillus sclerotialis]|uniref:Transcription factor n=1 Tax=Aspergillus sclerotialis TaxID=2070753 RepID=A0A3A2ZUP4_9EURO|nr:Transcription factor [Aspergillus sclerotialis]